LSAGIAFVPDNRTTAIAARPAAVAQAKMVSLDPDMKCPQETG
jgi:hypothetical protein